MASTARFTVSVRGLDVPDTDALVGTLRAELLDVGATRVEPVADGEAPPDARGVLADIAAGFDVALTVAQTAEMLIKVVREIQKWRAARAVRPDVYVAGIPVGDTEADARRVVEHLVRLTATGGASGVRRALIVANLAYDDPALRALRAPADDARALDRVLSDPRIGGFGVELCLDETEVVIRRRIADFFADRDRDDLLLVHYSGHGVKDARGRLYLAARDTELHRLAATAVPAAFVNDQMSETGSQRVVLILDCCYSGAFARGALARSDRTVHVAEEFGGEGRVVLTASSATEYAYEGVELVESDGQPSVFTGALVRGLESGEADLDNDGEITADELYRYVSREVRRARSGQAPKMSSLLDGPLVLAYSVRGAELDAGLREDLASERVGLRMEAVGTLTRLLASPKTAVRDAARAALRRLHEHDDSMMVRNAAGDVLATADAGAEPPKASPLASLAPPARRPAPVESRPAEAEPPPPRGPSAAPVAATSKASSIGFTPPNPPTATAHAPALVAADPTNTPRPLRTGPPVSPDTPVPPGMTRTGPPTSHDRPDRLNVSGTLSLLVAAAPFVAGAASVGLGIAFAAQSTGSTKAVLAGLQLFVYAAYQVVAAVASRHRARIFLLAGSAVGAVGAGVAVITGSARPFHDVAQPALGGFWLLAGVLAIAAATRNRRLERRGRVAEILIGVVAILGGGFAGATETNFTQDFIDSQISALGTLVVVIGVLLLVFGGRQLSDRSQGIR